MAELPEWSAQVLRYDQGNDGSVKVVYFRSRLEVTRDPFDQNSAWPKERPELGEQISFEASGSSDTRAVFSGQLFDDPVEVLNSRNYKLEGEKRFQDRKSALEDLPYKFNNFPRVFPFDIESSYGQKYSYIEPRLIKRSKEDDLLWYDFKADVTNAKDLKVVQDFKPVQDFKTYQDFEPFQDFEPIQHFEPVQDFEPDEDFDPHLFSPFLPWMHWRRRRRRGEGEEKGKGRDNEEEEKKEEKKETQETKDDNKKEEEEKERRRILQTRKELDGMPWKDGRQGYRCQCAFVFGITTKFNPNGVWIVEDIFYD